MGFYETPEYKVLLEEESFELRQYLDFYIIEYENGNDPYINSGFGTLFRYISSNNMKNEKISMTIPVIEEITGDKMKMAFVLPSKYKDDIPKPNNPDLKIRKFEKGLFAVVRYSGNSNKSKEEKHIEQLKKWIEKKNFKSASNFMLAFYNPPFVPGFLRRNEIMIRIEPLSINEME